MGRVASPYVPDDADRQLLRLLLAGGPVSGEEMSRDLNMTRAAVWKRIAHLREMGYDIESAPRKGYWLAGDVLKADAVLAASLFHYQEIAIPELKAYLARRGIPVRPVQG